MNNLFTPSSPSLPPLPPSETQSGTLLLPPGHGDTDNKNAEYDMVLRVYGGPGSQTVSRRYALGYDAYLASTLKVCGEWGRGREKGRERKRGHRVI